MIKEKQKKKKKKKKIKIKVEYIHGKRIKIIDIKSQNIKVIIIIITQIIFFIIIKNILKIIKHINLPIIINRIQIIIT